LLIRLFNWHELHVHNDLTGYKDNSCYPTDSAQIVLRKQRVKEFGIDLANIRSTPALSPLPLPYLLPRTFQRVPAFVPTSVLKSTSMFEPTFIL
jgi:hypothetical protein